MNIKLINLGESEAMCAACEEAANMYGAKGYSGYVDMCPEHAREAVEEAIESGWMEREPRKEEPEEMELLEFIEKPWSREFPID